MKRVSIKGMKETHTWWLHFTRLTAPTSHTCKGLFSLGEISGVAPGWRGGENKPRFPLEILTPAPPPSHPRDRSSPGRVQPCSGPGLKLLSPGLVARPGAKRVVGNDQG